MSGNSGRRRPGLGWGLAERAAKALGGRDKQVQDEVDKATGSDSRRKKKR
jgi:hypothetical protein